NVCYGQTTNDRKIKLAQSYEQVGQYDDAIRIYNEVYKEDKGYIAAFEGLVRSYKAKNMNTELLDLLEDRIKFDKTGLNYILLGEARWKAGKSKEADEAWKLAVEKEPTNPYVYKDMAEIQTQLQLFGKAINTYKSGRENLTSRNGQTLFVDELSKLYIAIGDNKSALNETLTMLQETGNLASVEARIYAMMQDDNSKKLIDETLEDYADKNSSNYLAMELYSWYQTNIGNHQKALEYTIKSDKISNSEGRVVLTFAGNSETAGNVDIALKAYQYIIDQGKSNKFFSSAIYSYTRVLEAKLMFEKHLDEDSVKEIIKRYKSIVEDFPKSSTAADAYLQIARLQKENLHQYKESENTLNELVKEIPGAKQSGDALIALSEIYISKGDLKVADDYLETAKARYGRNDPDLIESVDYTLAMIQYYTGNLDSASTLFNKLSQIKDNDIANDVLEKSSIIADKFKEEEKTKLFASAEYDLERLDTASAIGKYETIIKELNDYDTEIWQRSYLNLSEIYLSKNNVEKSNQYLEDLILKLPDGVHTDEAIYNLALNKISQKDNNRALELLSQILIKFPNSIYLSQARAKIREIRGES
ncbi:tetratricopeptide repeat protein, partial [bacterium]